MDCSASQPSSGDAVTKGLGDLPPKVFAKIIDMLRDPVPEHVSSGNEAWYRRTERKAEQRATLQTLSLVNEAIRKLAQPLLWKKASMGYQAESTLERTQNYERIFRARPEGRGWPTSLEIRLDSRTPAGPEVLSDVARVIAQLNSIYYLHIERIYDAVEQAPPQLFASLTTLHIADVSPPLNVFLSILTQCPRLQYLYCNIRDGDFGISTVPDHTIPLLTRLLAPMSLARLLVPGRPVEDLTILPSYSEGHDVLWCSNDLHSLVEGSRPLRNLYVSGFRWSNGCIEEVARLFPSLEKLELNLGQASVRI